MIVVKKLFRIQYNHYLGCCITLINFSNKKLFSLEQFFVNKIWDKKKVIVNNLQLKFSCSSEDWAIYLQLPKYFFIYNLVTCVRICIRCHNKLKNLPSTIRLHCGIKALPYILLFYLSTIFWCFFNSEWDQMER